jgi:hypothetical protein
MLERILESVRRLGEVRAASVIHHLPRGIILLLIPTWATKLTIQRDARDTDNPLYFYIPDLTAHPEEIPRALLITPLVNTEMDQAILVTVLFCVFGVLVESRLGTLVVLALFWFVSSVAALGGGLLLHLIHPYFSHIGAIDEGMQRIFNGQRGGCCVVSAGDSRRARGGRNGRWRRVASRHTGGRALPALPAGVQQSSMVERAPFRELRRAGQRDLHGLRVRRQAGAVNAALVVEPRGHRPVRRVKGGIAVERGREADGAGEDGEHSGAPVELSPLRLRVVDGSGGNAVRRRDLQHRRDQERLGRLMRFDVAAFGDGRLDDEPSRRAAVRALDPRAQLEPVLQVVCHGGHARPSTIRSSSSTTAVALASKRSMFR